jgi:PilZ domain
VAQDTRRPAERIKRRITCELLLDGRRYRGIVLDVSATGIFVQTEATPGPGSSIRVRFHAAGGEEFEVAAAVARRRVAPPQLATVVRGGLGLRLLQPPPAYFEMTGIAAPVAGRAAAARKGPASGAAGAAKAPAPKPAPDPDLEFRVRVKQTDGPRSRSLKIRAASPDAARRAALRQLGRGWEILSVDAA